MTNLWENLYDINNGDDRDFLEQLKDVVAKSLEISWIIEDRFNLKINVSPQDIDIELTDWQNACDIVRKSNPEVYFKYCKQANEKSEAAKPLKESPQITDAGEPTQATDLTQQAQALINAPHADQCDFICTAPEEVWEEVLQIIFEGADPAWWARKRNNYDPDWQAKAAKKKEKRAKQRKAYTRNGRSVYPSKTNNNNGTYNVLELAPA